MRAVASQERPTSLPPLISCQFLPLSYILASRHLLNPLAPLGQPTPSELDGVPKELERDLRACQLPLPFPSPLPLL